MNEVEQIFGPGGAIEAFEAAKKAGKCRFIGFTGHHDPEVHLAMLKHYDKYDTIIMPLNPADPHYLSFEKAVLPVAVDEGWGSRRSRARPTRGCSPPCTAGLPELRAEPAGALRAAGLHHGWADRR